MQTRTGLFVLLCFIVSARCVIPTIEDKPDENDSENATAESDESGDEYDDEDESGDDNDDNIKIIISYIEDKNSTKKNLTDSSIVGSSFIKIPSGRRFRNRLGSDEDERLDRKYGDRTTSRDNQFGHYQGERSGRYGGDRSGWTRNHGDDRWDRRYDERANYYGDERHGRYHDERSRYGDNRQRSDGDRLNRYDDRRRHYDDRPGRYHGERSNRNGHERSWGHHAERSDYDGRRSRRWSGERSNNYRDSWSSNKYYNDRGHYGGRNHHDDDWDRGHREKWSSYEKDERSGRYEDRHHHKDKRLHKTELTMPSGAKKRITDPPYNKKWNCQKSALSNFKKIHLKSDGKMGKIEYNYVKDEFDNTWAGTPKKTIVKVEKIEKTCTWKKYKYRKDRMKTENNGTDINERLLFYGENDAKLQSILQNGFDERELYITSTPYGACFQFSAASSTSDALCNAQTSGNKIMLLSRVVLGKVEALTAATQVAHPHVGYNSVQHGNEYCVYRGEEAYPEYLITYQ